MKMLKYACPFGWKHYPWIAAIAAALLMLPVAMKSKLSGFWLSLLMYSVPVLVLAVCLFREQRLTPDERSLCEEAELPLWEPLTPELAAQIRTQEANKKSPILIAGVLSLVFGAFLMFYVSAASKTAIQSGDSSGAAAAGFLGALLPFTAVMLRHLRSETWKQIDETAVFARVPIHHSHEVQRRSRSRTTGEPTERIERYLVCYLPDGRYTLHARADAEESHAVLFVKYGGSVRWIPEPPITDNPESL